MPPRSLAALAGLALFAAPAAAQPGLPPQGKSVQLEYIERMPYTTVWGRQYFLVYPIEQGDRFKVEMSAVGGVELGLMVRVEKAVGNNVWEEVERASGTGDVTLNPQKGLPGRSARVVVAAYGVGKVNVRVTRLDAEGKEYPAPGGAAAPGGGGAPPAPAGLEARLQRLEQQNADLARQLAEIRRLLERKN